MIPTQGQPRSSLRIAIKTGRRTLSTLGVVDYSQREFAAGGKGLQSEEDLRMRRNKELIMTTLSSISRKEEPSELRISDIRADDEVLIETRNSTYVFVLTDPEERSGLLYGGRLGQNISDAIIVGTIAEDGKMVIEDSPVLRTNSRALFFLRARGGLEQFLTSAISGLTYVKGHAIGPNRRFL